MIFKIPASRELLSKKLDTRQLEILTNFLRVARLIGSYVEGA